MGFKMEQWGRGELSILPLLFLGLFGLYLRCASPAFPANDSPETISAAWELGIQHPPGYPLDTLLGRCAILVCPLGSPAWRMNCLSALLGCACAGASALLVFEIAPGAGLLACSAAFAATGLWRVSWEQATEAKGGVYLLNLLLCLLMLCCFVRLQRKAELWAAQLFWFLAGLGLANHYMSAILVILPCGLWMAWKGRENLKEWIWVLPGLSLYLLLPLRAQYHPFNNFGDPQSLEGFLWVLLRTGYSQNGLSSDWGVVFDQARLWALNSLSFGAYWVAPLGLFGFYWLGQKRRELALFFAALYSLIWISVVVINRTLPDVRWLADIFILPGQGLLASGAGLGILALGELPWRRALLATALLGAVLLSLGLQFSALDRSQDYGAYDFGQNLMLSMPRSSLYLAEGDYFYMPLLYLQQVEGRRKDVEILISSLLDQKAYEERLLQRRGLALQAQSVPEAVRALFLDASLVVSTYHPSLGEQDVPPLRFWQDGLLQHLAPRGHATLEAIPAWSLRLDPREPTEPLDGNLWPWYTVVLVNSGNQLSGDGQYAAAAAAYRLATETPGQKPLAQIFYNLGNALEGAHETGPATEAFERSLSIDPGLQASRDELVKLGNQADPWKAMLAEADLDAQGRHPLKARQIYEAALAQGMRNSGLYRNLGILKYQSKDFSGAEDCFAKASALDPGSATLYQYQVMALQNYASRDQLRALLEKGIRRTQDPSLKGMLQKLTP